ncbi:hypothetical protein CBS101457_003479 [Exobasidium rhododendri]|nr:hypothetical protein CBS101457_003479 [Exobasidium rhododendri]
MPFELDSASSSDSELPVLEKKSLSQRGQQRRRNTDHDTDDPSYHPKKGSRVKPMARHTMPAQTSDAAAASPRPAQTPSKATSSTNHVASPKRTPSKPSVQQRFESVNLNATAVLDFYADVAQRLSAEEIELEEDMDDEMNRCWELFQTSKKHQVFAKHTVQSDFLDEDEVSKGNELKEVGKEARTVGSLVRLINRAVFVHYIAQLPFQSPTSTPSKQGKKWTVDKFRSYVSSKEAFDWPILDISTLESARKDFLTKVVNHREKILVTIDDLYLFYDISTQIIIYYLAEDFDDKQKIDRSAAKRRVDELYSPDLITESLLLIAKDETERKAVEKIGEFCKKVAASKGDEFRDLKYDAKSLQRKYPYKSMVLALLGYVEALRHRGLFDLSFPPSFGGLAMPKHVKDNYSPLLKGIAMKEVDQASKRNGKAGRKKRADEEEEDQEEEEEEEEEDGDEEEEERQSLSSDHQEEEPRRSSRAKQTVMRFDSKSRLSRVEAGSEGPSGLVVNRRGAEQIRDREFDVGDTDPLMEEDIRRHKQKSKQEKKKEQEKGSKKAKARKGKERNDSTGESASNAPQDRAEEEAAEEEALPASGGKKGKERALSPPIERQARPDSNDDYEIAVEEQTLEQERVDGQARSQKRKAKRKASGDDHEGDDVNEEVGAEDGPADGPSKTSPSKKAKTEKGKRVKGRSEIIPFRYATGGNIDGRKVWSADETECLVRELENLYPMYLQARAERGASFFMWKEILDRHGKDGTTSETLKMRNNVQLKDKARNIVQRMIKDKIEVSKLRLGLVDMLSYSPSDSTIPT